MGFSYLPSQMNSWSKWIFLSNPARAAFQSIVHNQISGRSYFCTPDELVPLPVSNATTLLYCPYISGDEYLRYLSIGTDYLWFDLIPMFGWLALLWFLWTLSMMKVWIRR